MMHFAVGLSNGSRSLGPSECSLASLSPIDGRWKVDGGGVNADVAAIAAIRFLSPHSPFVPGFQ